MNKLLIILLIILIIILIWKISSISKFNTNIPNKNIDKIYVINLKKNTDRWDSISRMAKKANVNITRFDAIYGKELESNHQDILKYFVKDHKLYAGQIGCALSHIKIWEDAIKNNYKNIIIFEDDAIIPEDFWRKFNNAYNELPKDWDMLLLGGVLLGGTIYSNNLLKPDKRSDNYGTSSMLINLKFIKNIINDLKLNKAIDNYLRDIFYYDNYYHIFIVKKMINCINYSFNSDIGVSVPNKNYEIKIYENFSNNKKIALCFLIYDKINHEDIWFKWLNNINKNKYNIYIHFKENKKLKYFEQYKLKNTIDTCWGCLSIVNAQLLILKEALKDKNNKHFIWLSQSCIPFKSFNYVYNYLDINKSYYNGSPDSQVFPRANKALKYIKKENIKKYSMPSIICKKHAQVFVNNEKNINIWFKDINNVDEIVFLTILYHNKLQNEIIITNNISIDAIIYTKWDDMNNNKKFNNSVLTKTTPYSYKHIGNDELDYLINSKSLFGRKFEVNCTGLEKLIEKINYVTL
jgi:GR25 family glycosyltransferase involved in LPS biosynthesis